MTGARALDRNKGGRGHVIDLAGQVFGRLIVVDRLSADEVRLYGCGGTSAYWLCRCGCGRQKPVMGRNLRIGKSRTCGAPKCREAAR